MKTEYMKKSLLVTRALLASAVLLGLGGCQFFYDERQETMLLVSADDWSDLRQFKKDERARQIQAARPVPAPGSEMISFANLTDAYLSGCRSLGIVEVHHNGPYEEAVILMRNQALELDASVIVPLDIYQDKTALGKAAPQTSFIKGRMLRCPAQTNNESA